MFRQTIFQALLMSLSPFSNVKNIIKIIVKPLEKRMAFIYNITCVYFAGIAQLVEQLIRNEQVACSSHVSSSNKDLNRRVSVRTLFCFIMPSDSVTVICQLIRLCTFVLITHILNDSVTYAPSNTIFTYLGVLYFKFL